MADETDAKSRGFLAELRDAVTPRAFLMVFGVLLLQLGFIASYLGAFHNPKPREIPIAIAAPPGAAASIAAQTGARLNALPGHPVKAHTVADEATARAQIEDRSVYGAILLGASQTDTLLVASAAGSSVSAALETVTQAVDQSQGRTSTVLDVVPAGRGDARGLSAFYLVVGWVVGGYLCAAILGIAGGARPTNRNRAVIRLGALALYAIVSGLGGAVLSETILDSPVRPLRLAVAVRRAPGVRGRRVHHGGTDHARHPRHRSGDRALRDPGQPERRRRVPGSVAAAVLGRDRRLAASRRGHGRRPDHRVLPGCELGSGCLDSGRLRRHRAGCDSGHLGHATSAYTTPEPRTRSCG